MARPLKLDAEQARWFRARRTGLAQPLADTAAEVQAQLFEELRSLVRTWGNRGTIHLYDVDHWRHIIACKPVWGVDMPRAELPPDEVGDKARAIANKSDQPLSRSRKASRSCAQAHPAPRRSGRCACCRFGVAC